MAVAAETLPFQQTYSPEKPKESIYIAADHVPELSFVRQRARQEAAAIRENYRQLLIDGAFDSVPLDVDALGTARRAVEAAHTYGTDSEQYRERLSGLWLDSKRLLAEAYRKNTYEYFPPAPQHYHEETGAFFSHGQSVLEITRLGLSPVTDTEEADRRVNDWVEARTHAAMHRLIGRAGLSHTVRIRTISECSDTAISKYKSGVKEGYYGYVPEIEKLMIRDFVFNAETGERFEELVGLSGLHITHEVILDALRRRGANSGGDKTWLHGTQLIVEDDLFEFVALLDSVASEHSGQEIYMGEPLPSGQTKSYETVRAEAVARQAQLDAEASLLADYVLQLELNQTDRWVAVKMVENFVKKRLLQIAAKEPSRAAEMFDARTAAGLQEVAYLNSLGRTSEAQIRFNEVEAQAPAPGYCGAGSCGLEGVDKQSLEGRELGAFLKAGWKDEIVKDKERSCKNCGRKSVYYAYNSRKVNKGCTSCKAFESKGT